MACGESMKFAGLGGACGLRGKRGGAIPGAEAGEEPLEDELVAAADPGLDPQALEDHEWLPNEGTVPLPPPPPGPLAPPLKFAATAAAAAAANAIATAELFCASFASPTEKNGGEVVLFYQNAQ